MAKETDFYGTKEHSLSRATNSIKTKENLIFQLLNLLRKTVLIEVGSGFPQLSRPKQNA